MPTLTIRNLPADVHRDLRVRAARAGRSMEAEARAILAEAVQPERTGSALRVREWVERAYGSRKPAGVVDELIAERRREAEE